MRRIAIINQKGGVGKTTTAVNLGAALAHRGQRVLLIDLDPQAHLTMSLGLTPSSGEPNIYHGLTESVPLCRLRRSVRENLWVVASHIDLAAAEVELVSVVGREVILRDLIEQDGQSFDFVLMDCPPSLGILTLNALAAANEVLIPLQPQFLALQGVGKLLETVMLVARRINPALRVTGIVLCMYDGGTRLTGEVVEDLDKFLASWRGKDTPWSQARIFETVIRRNIRLAECPSHGLPIMEYAPRSNGAIDYMDLACELLGEPRPSMLARADSSGPTAAATEAEQPPVHADSGADVRPAEQDLAGARPIRLTFEPEAASGEAALQAGPPAPAEQRTEPPQTSGEPVCPGSPEVAPPCEAVPQPLPGADRG